MGCSHLNIVMNVVYHIFVIYANLVSFILQKICKVNGWDGSHAKKVNADKTLKMIWDGLRQYADDDKVRNGPSLIIQQIDSDQQLNI